MATTHSRRARRQATSQGPALDIAAKNARPMMSAIEVSSDVDGDCPATCPALLRHRFQQPFMYADTRRSSSHCIGRARPLLRSCCTTHGSVENATRGRSIRESSSQRQRLFRVRNPRRQPLGQWRVGLGGAPHRNDEAKASSSRRRKWFTVQLLGVVALECQPPHSVNVGLPPPRPTG